MTKKAKTLTPTFNGSGYCPIKETQAQHTPGPWKAWDGPEPDGVLFRAVVEGQRRTIRGDVIDVPVAYLLREEDADLIAAAPELLAALKDICGAADNGQPYTTAEIEQMFVPIVAKAEGR